MPSKALDAPDRPAVRRADDDRSSVVVLGDLVQHLGGRARTNQDGDLMICLERLRHGLEPLTSRLAHHDRVLGRHEACAALTWIGSDERKRPVPEPGEGLGEGERSGVVIAQRETDDDWASHGLLLIRGTIHDSMLGLRAWQFVRAMPRTASVLRR